MYTASSILGPSVFRSNLIEFMPQPVNLENIEGRWGIKSCVDARDLYSGSAEMFKNIIGREWERMYRRYSDYIVSLTIGRDNWLVHKAQAEVYLDSTGFTPVFNLRLFVETFVAQSSRVVIPEIEWTYSKVDGYSVKEWRCGYCRSPNIIKDRHCTQCGSPRALLMQEM
jgi:hypothetical protein